ncbi:glutamate ligase domain-containing protein, partial [Candidatus Bipolaricaulota bacterium]
YAILNADDPFTSAIAEATSAQILTYGIDSEADIRAVEIRAEARISRFTVVVRGEERASVSLPQPGSHSISNALAALSVGIVKRIPLSVLAERADQVEPIPGRTEFFRRDDGVDAVVDFAHNPSSLEVILKFLRSEYPRIIALFGCPGDGEHEKRAAMGEVSGRWADAIVLTSDNPKNEDPRVIVDEIQAGIGKSRVPVTVILDRERAIQASVSQARAGDIVLLAGKGHETDQLIGDNRFPHADADVLRRLGFAGDI